jgi:PAS domain S-box-containing protein
MSNQNSPHHLVVLACLVATLSYLAARLGGALIIRPQMVSPLWLGNVLLVAVLLLVRRSIWPLLLAAGLAAFFLYDLQAGGPIRSIAWLILSNAVEVLTAALCLSKSFDGVPRLNSVKALAKYSFYAVFLAPFVGAFLGALSTRSNYWASWKVAFFSEALGFLTLMPAILGWAREIPAWAQRPRAYYLEAAALLAALVILGHFTFAAPGSSPPALLYSLVPVLLWFALRFGSTGVSTAMIAICFVSIWGAVHGRGPFSEPGAFINVLSLQLFLFFTAAPFMALAALVEERKRGEGALRESEARERAQVKRLEALLDAAPIAILIATDTECKRITANRTGSQLHHVPIGANFSRNSFPIKPLPFRIMRDGVEIPTEELPLQRTAATGIPVFGELSTLVLEDGAEHHLIGNVAPLFDDDGKPCGAVGAFVDITERKRAEEELRESEEKFRSVFRDAGIGMAIVSPGGGFLAGNEAFSRFIGYTEEELLGKTVQSITHPEDWPMFSKRLNLALADGASFQGVQKRCLHKNGQVLCGECSASLIRDLDGKPQYFVAEVLDVTERKRTEEALRESEKRFRLVADTAPALIWMSGTDKLCTFFNKAWLEFTGQSIEHELGEGWASGVHPEDLERCLRIYRGAFDARVDFEMEYRLRRFDGSYRWIVDYGVPRAESDGTFLGYIGSCVDITERKLTAQSLEDLSGRLITSQEEERARIARELHDDFSQRLALHSIGLAQLWKKLPESEVEERAEVQELLKRTREMASDMRSLSYQLHSTRLEHVGLELALEGLCKEMSSKYNIEIEFTQLGVSSEIPKDVALCLFRIAQEALGNVVKHSHAKQAQAELRGADNEIRLRVVDVGAGFDPRLTHTGIGLVSMRERLRLVGGTLSVRSAPSKGTEILAQVPLSAQMSETQRKTRAAGE